MLDGHVGFAVKVLVAIHYSVLAARKHVESGKVNHLQRLLEPGN